MYLKKVCVSWVRGTRGTANAGTRWPRWDSAGVLLFRDEACVVDLLGICRTQIEPETLPVVIYVVKNYDLTVTDDCHTSRRCCVIRLVVYAILWQSIIQIGNTFRHTMTRF